VFEVFKAHPAFVGFGFHGAVGQHPGRAAANDFFLTT
jgi:hypothetical protein